MDPKINLHKWQIEAANSWEQNGNIGVVNAVTGTGIFAIECIRRFISNAIVNIIVPTRVLMFRKLSPQPGSRYRWLTWRFYR